MEIFGKQLTIFQKMLVAPLIGLVLYSLYLVYTHREHTHSSHTLEQLRDSYLPVLDITGENVILFSAIADNLKDAVLAGEPDWVLNTKAQSTQIEANLKKLEDYPNLIPRQQLLMLQTTYRLYYDNAFSLSMTMLTNDASSEERNRLIDNVGRYHGEVEQSFASLKQEIQQRLSREVEETNQGLRRLLWVGVSMGVLLILLVTAISFALSLSTRRSLAQVNHALKSIAQDRPDFTARLARNSNDELGELVGWFNLLSEKLEQDYKKIELLSITDKLTQLYNRTKIDELFEMELLKASRYQVPLSVIMLDLDHFKSVNDSHGHHVGDTVLQELSSILSHNVRSCDHLGRWGGEEFIIIVPDTDLTQARQMAEKLRQAIAEYEFSVVGHKTGSFGVATYREGDSDASLSKRADDCLYQAKERGRNLVIDETVLSVMTERPSPTTL